MRRRYVMAWVALVALAAVGIPSVGRAEPEKWHAGVIGGGELNFAPNLDNQADSKFKRPLRATLHAT